MTEVYEDHGIRFAIPPGWEVESDQDGATTTVSLHAPDGMAFLLIRLDTNRPEPADLAEEALDAMRAEYPDLDAEAARERIAGHPAVGHDLEFFSFDLTNDCVIRALRTDHRSILLFAQWSELDADEAEAVLRTVRATLVEA